MPYHTHPYTKNLHACSTEHTIKCTGNHSRVMYFVLSTLLSLFFSDSFKLRCAGRARKKTYKGKKHSVYVQKNKTQDNENGCIHCRETSAHKILWGRPDCMQQQSWTVSYRNLSLEVEWTLPLISFVGTCIYILSNSSKRVLHMIYGGDIWQVLFSFLPDPICK